MSNEAHISIVKMQKTNSSFEFFYCPQEEIFVRTFKVLWILRAYINFVYPLHPLTFHLEPIRNRVGILLRQSGLTPPCFPIELMLKTSPMPL